MCTFSMIADHYNDKWRHDYPWAMPPQPAIMPPQAFPTPNTVILSPAPEVTKADLDALRKEVEDLKALLIRAKKYDADNNEPDCEVDEKIAILRRVAELVGVDLGEVLKPVARGA